MYNESRHERREPMKLETAKAGLKFPNAPEAKRLVEAKAKVNELFQKEMAIDEEALEQRIGQVTASPRSALLQSALKDRQSAEVELDSAREAYYLATGEDTWPVPVEPQYVEAFQLAVEEHFGKIAISVGSKLERLRPWFYGFAAPRAIVSISILGPLDRGMLPKIKITLRERVQDEPVRVFDDYGCVSLDGAIPLERLVRLFNSDGWGVSPRFASNAQVKDLAARLSSYGQPFLVESNPELWRGLRGGDFWTVHDALPERSWLRRFNRDV